MNIEQLKKIQTETLSKLDKYKAALMICAGTGCVSAGSFTLKDLLEKEIKKRNMENDILVVPTGCNGFCAQGPIMVIQPEGIFYQKVKPEDIPEIIDNLLEGKYVERLLYKDLKTKQAIPKMDDIRFFGKQQLIALRNKGIINPENIEDAIARGAYQALAKVLKTNKEDIIKEIIKSGIRGRGGGGFPTGVKWESALKAAEKKNEEPYVICNADEGDPGAFMDRSIVEADPHTVIEGMAIGALAVGAKEGFVYIRNEYPLALKRLEIAIKQAHEKGLLGKNILDSDFCFDIHIHRGAGAFVCGESSALMASMSGRAGEPRAKYVHNVEVGYRGKPTVLNNVETWANIPVIIDKGAKWFASIGSGDVSENPWNGSSGTKVFSLVGNIVNSGLVEVPMGITLREIIYDIGGGIPNGRKFKAIQTGGPSGGCIPADQLDLPVDFDSLTEAGSMMGSGGMIVMDDKTCMVDVAKYFISFLKDESCGKCTPCREGLISLFEILNRITKGEGKEGDIELMKEIAETMEVASLCALGQTAAYPVLSTIRYFRDEYEAHIKDKKCPAGVCKPLITYSVNDNCTGCTICARNCPVDAISGKVKEKHFINTDKCIKCNVCYEVCKFKAITVE
ncbi:MAG: NADH-quinone oxidoreductase subunit NuoF [Candidatus Cloacimonetes bacterium]|nr:NADH-quinone oxidoreductase subunit NuoF [Candidatus Cloacimonadota bacterium]